MNPGGASPSLPSYALGPSLLIYTVLVLFLAYRCRSASGAFVLIAVAIRLGMSAAPFISFASSGVGLSWNALMSCIVIGTGTLVVRRSAMLSYALPPIVALVCVIAISGLVNDRIPESIETILKYGYFAVLALTVHDACKSEGPDTFLGKLLLVLLLPIVLQLESIGLGVVKASEGDGSASYIGGYNHEASFSLLLIAALLAVSLNQRISIKLQFLVATVCALGVILANYRTAMGAMVPMIISLLVVNGMRKVVKSQQILAIGTVSLAILCVLPIVLSLFAERFETLTILLQNPGLPFKDPGAFTYEERQVMSGRAMIWAEYLEVWREAPSLQKFVGFGADAWEDYFSLYAHNTLVSTVFEFGIAGLSLMVLLWAWMITIAWRCGPPVNLILIASHFGFILLNMATMPFWMIEGLVFYGLLCGVGLYAFDSVRRSKTRAGASLPPQPSWLSGWTQSPPERVKPGTAAERYPQDIK